jgi:hypothetical protein
LADTARPYEQLIKPVLSKSDLLRHLSRPLA